MLRATCPDGGPRCCSCQSDLLWKKWWSSDTHLLKLPAGERPLRIQFAEKFTLLQTRLWPERTDDPLPPPPINAIGRSRLTPFTPEQPLTARERLGRPRFMLYDLRKLVATTGERLTVEDAVLRRILNHSAPCLTCCTSTIFHLMLPT